MSAKLIYQRLFELHQSGKYYDYYPEHLCNMDCFYNLDKFLEQSGKRKEYNENFLTLFREEVEKVLEKCQGKIRPIINPHVECHLWTSTSQLDLALNALDQSSFDKFNAAVNYLNDKSPLQYHDLPSELPVTEDSTHLILNRTPNGHVSIHDGKKIFNCSCSQGQILGKFYFSDEHKKISTIVSVNRLNKRQLEFTVDPEIEEKDKEIVGSVFNASYVKLFNALEALIREDQIKVLCLIVKQQLQEYYLSSFAEMLLEPNNLCYGEIVLMVRSALNLYDDEELQKCIEFFRKTDQETESDFKMGL